VPVTMKDVAQEADVSIKTVSRVVNQQGEISDETRTRVLNAIDKLGYRPSKVARALVTSRTDTIGLMVADIANPYFSEVARGVMDTARDSQYDVFLCNTDGKPESEKRALFSLLDHNVDGAIVYPTYNNQDWLAEFSNPDRPMVLANCELESKPGLNTVVSEIRKGARLAVEYLIGKGHQKIGMLAGEVAPKSTIQRVQGYRDGLLAHGLEYCDELIILGPAIFEHGYETSQKLLAEFPEVSALFCYNDLIALGALQACKDLGVRVPEDCAVIGFDNIRFGALTNPSLTTIHVDKYNIGAQAAKCLIEMLREPGEVLAPIRIGVELVVRESA
jgi:LacI family transcriptional regulator